MAHETESSARHTLQLLSAAIIRAQTDNPATSQHILIRHLQELFLARHINICCTAARWQRHPAQLPHQGSRTRNGTWLVRQTDITTPDRIPPTAGYAWYSTTGIVIVPNPADEIREVWNEARNIVGLILAFTAISLILIAWPVKRSLRPVNEISAGLVYELYAPRRELP